MPSIDIIEYVRCEQRNGGYFSLYTISPEDHIMIGWDAMFSTPLGKCVPPPVEGTPPVEPGKCTPGVEVMKSGDIKHNSATNNVYYNANYNEANFMMSSVYLQYNAYVPEFYIPRTLVPVRPSFGEAFHDELVPIDPWVYEYDGEFSTAQALWHGAVWDDTCARQPLVGVPWAPPPVDGATTTTTTTTTTISSSSKDPLEGMDASEREKCTKQAEEETDTLLRAAIQHAWYDLEQTEEKVVSKPTPRDQRIHNASDKTPRASSPEIGG